MGHWLVGCLVLVISSSAWAQAAAQDEAEDSSAQLDQAARLLYESGTAAYDAGRFEEALMRYQNAYRLSQRPELRYNVAVCFDRLDRKREAADGYESFLDALPNSPRAAVARSRLEVLRASLAREAGSADDHDATPTDAVEHPSPSLAGPAMAFGLGGAGLATFAIAAIITHGRYGDAKAQCNEGDCEMADLGGVNRSALIADIGLGVAVAGAAVGVILLLTGGDDSGAEHARLTPALGPDGGGLVVQGTF